MSVIDEVKSRLDIVEVVSSYIPLQKSGRNYKALCPFHAEKTPSFIVFPENQHWHCFGACSEGGDIFTFVMKREGWDFRTALEELARRAGVELRPRTPAQVQAEEEADRLRELLAETARYYHHLLRHAAEAEAVRAYVARRGLSDETVNQFLLGYSLPGWDNARAYLTEEGYTVEELIKAGLLVQREDTGSTYDRFRDRLMIPIRDVQGRVIGFGARTLDPEGVPKYLNSPQTSLFDKSHTLFGLDLARQAIRREDRVVIVEGYMDVMQAHQAGFVNVVALEQEWEPVFDPRGLAGYEGRLGVEIRVLHLPSGQDPDDLIREDAQRWVTLVDEAVPVVDFYLRILLEGLDLEDTKAKAQVVDTLLPVLQAVANPVEREDYAQKIARTLRVDARAVLARLRGTGRRAARYRRDVDRPREGAARESAEADLESYCLMVLLRRASLLSRVNKTLSESQIEPLQGQDFQDAGNRAIFEAWETLLAGEHPASVEALLEQLPDDLQARLEGWLVPDEAGLADEQLLRDVIRTLLRLRERNLRYLVQELTFLTLEAQEAGDVRAEQYDQAKLAYIQTLSRTQKALARRWTLVHQG
jgi:DNA primase